MSQEVVTEAMVLAKERENAQRREELRKRSNSVINEAEPDPNFPPECCCVKPIIYHNISLQVPVPQQRFMYILCGLYLSLIVLIIYNIVAALLALVLAGGSVLHFGLSFLYLLGIPGAWVLWYYNVYMATTQNSRPRQVLALFGLFLGIAFDAWMAVGVPGFGGDGWIITITSMGNIAAFIPFLIAAILWTLHGLILGIMFIRYWKVSNDLMKGGAYIYRNVVV